MFIGAALSNTGNKDVQCTYVNSDFKSEDDVDTWIQKFGRSDDFNHNIMPFYCATGDNIAGKNCRRWCADDPDNVDCGIALHQFCTRGDNAINSDLCYSTCTGDDKPDWCDIAVVSACNLVPHGAPAAAATAIAESFTGFDESRVFHVYILAVLIAVLVAYTLIFMC